MGKMPEHVFHGGCFECTRQEKDGVDFCVKCMYFDADWELPNLNNKLPTETDLLKKELKRRYKIK